MYYMLILTALSFDILIKARACSTYYNVPYPSTSGVQQEKPLLPEQGYRGYNSPNPINIVIRPQYPGQTSRPAFPSFEGRSSDRNASPIERRKLISSVLTLPGMLADKLISGEISV